MNFVDFIKEATSTASQQAARLGLQGNGHGDWYDNNGKLVAKTVKGSLKFFGKKKGAGEDEPSVPNKDSVVGQKIPHDQQQAPEEPAEDQPTKGPLTIGFGRFNPPTVGHEALLKTIKKTAADGEYKVYPSHSQDSKKNPLDSETKVGFMKAMFPDHANNIIHDTKMRTIFDVLKSAYADGHSEVNIVVGADRRGEFESLANKYNGQLYNFENINIISAGNRDPDAEGVEGMSASKLRKAAGDGDFDTFVNGIFEGRGFKFKVKLTSDDPAQNIKISELGYTATFQRRQEQSATAIVSGSGVKNITFDKPFFVGTSTLLGANTNLPSIGITATDNITSGDYFQLTNISATGFSVHFKNSTNASINRNFNFVAVGFGKGA